MGVKLTKADNVKNIIIFVFNINGSFLLSS